MARCSWTNQSSYQFVYVTQYLGFAVRSEALPLFANFTQVQFQSKLENVKGSVKAAQADLSTRVKVLERMKSGTLTDQFVKGLGLKTLKEVGMAFDRKRKKSSIKRIDDKTLEDIVIFHTDKRTRKVRWKDVHAAFPDTTEKSLRNRWDQFRRHQVIAEWDQKTKSDFLGLYEQKLKPADIARKIARPVSECRIAHLVLLREELEEQDKTSEEKEQEQKQAEKTALIALSMLSGPVQQPPVPQPLAPQQPSQTYAPQQPPGPQQLPQTCALQQLPVPQQPPQAYYPPPVFQQPPRVYYPPSTSELLAMQYRAMLAAQQCMYLVARANTVW